jgi:aquaporin Z
VTVGLTVARRFASSEVVPYVGAQVLGALAGAIVVYLIVTGRAEYHLTKHWFAANGFAEHSPGGYSLTSAFIVEAIMTFAFLFVILGATDKRAPAGFAPLAIGLCLTLIHLISIPVTNTSVNPARSTGPALVVGGWALAQLWVFWLAPLVGAAIAGLVYPWISGATQGAPEAGGAPGPHPSPTA